MQQYSYELRDKTTTFFDWKPCPSPQKPDPLPTAPSNDVMQCRITSRSWPKLGHHPDSNRPSRDNLVQEIWFPIWSLCYSKLSKIISFNKSSFCEEENEKKKLLQIYFKLEISYCTHTYSSIYSCIIIKIPLTLLNHLSIPAFSLSWHFSRIVAKSAWLIFNQTAFFPFSEIMTGHVI